MATVKIDEVEYDSDVLSEEAKQQLGMLQATDQEIARLNVVMAIAQTARIAYANALKEALPKEDDSTTQQ